jgi:hypothetical protein
VAAVKTHCWNQSKRLFADSPAHVDFSQHANAMAVLAGAIEGPEGTDLMRRVAADPSLIQCSTYFRFYLLQAMKRAHLGNDYLAQLGPWRAMLALGLTTFAEKPEPTRSDCHAWSASPVYDLLATVVGIEPATPGFTTVKIAPHLGTLARADGVVPHPAGEIRATLERRGGGIIAEVTLPPGISGTFEWNGQTVALRAGEQSFEVP